MLKEIIAKIWHSFCFHFNSGALDAFQDAGHETQQQRKDAHRAHILKLADDGRTSSQRVYEEFLAYCQSFDKELRETKTQELLKTICLKHPEIRTSLDQQPPAGNY